jgi:hypothetical protein
VVGATTMIFSIIVLLTSGLTANLDKLSLIHAPFLLGLVTGGAVIYWFTGASIQAVAAGAYQAVEFIKRNIKLDGSAQKASVSDSKKVVEICTKYAQRGMFNIFLTVFFSTLAFACLEPFFFIGYLISIALFGLYQAIFMANAGGAWDNAKKVVEVDLKEKGTSLHAATVVGDTVGDPFKDTSSVAMNPIIKFTTLFGLLAVELAIEMEPGTSTLLAAVFFAISTIFVWRSFYTMRIERPGQREVFSLPPPLPVFHLPGEDGPRGRGQLHPQPRDHPTQLGHRGLVIALGQLAQKGHRKAQDIEEEKRQPLPGIGPATHENRGRAPDVEGAVGFVDPDGVRDHVPEPGLVREPAAVAVLFHPHAPVGILDA